MPTRETPFARPAATGARKTMPRSTTNPFRWEADMTEFVERSITALTPASARPDVVLEQVQGAIGVLDLIAVFFDDEALSQRIRGGVVPVTLPLRVQVLHALGRRPPTRVETLARRLRRNPRALISSTLRPLAELGALELRGDRVVATGAWRPVVRRMIAVELKLSKWRDAVRQADNAAMSADAAWVVLDRAKADGALAARSYFRAFGVGLAVIDPSGGFDVVFRPGRRRAVRWLRSWLGELAWDATADHVEWIAVAPVAGR